MTTNHHTAIAFGAAATSANINGPLGELDSVLTDMLAGDQPFDDLNFDDAVELTISGGAITVTQAFHTVDTEGDAGTDYLDTINGGEEGDLLFLRGQDDTHVVTVRHATDNIYTYLGVNIELDEQRIVLFMHDGTNWTAVSLGAININDLFDVDNSGLADNDLLAYDSGSGVWTNQTAAAAGVAAASHTHDAGDVTYTPTTLTDWDGDADPGDLDDALDQLAERIDDVEGTAVDVYENGVSTVTTIDKLDFKDFNIEDLTGNDAGIWHNLPFICQGRLTLTTATPVTTSDVTAATTLYFTPWDGDKISLYDGTRWKVYTFTERSIAVPASTDTNYDVFLYDNAGTLTLELTAWTNDSTRATALTTQDSIYVKTGATTRRYLGTIRTTDSSGECEDSTSRRFVWNYYNRVERLLLAVEATNSWTYTTDTWREANGGAVGLGATNVQILIGVDDQPIHVEVVCGAYWSEAGAPASAVGVGLDSSSTNSALIFGYFAPNVGGNTQAKYVGHPGIGEQIIYWLERTSAGSGTITWLGDSGVTLLQSGMVVRLKG